MRPTRNDTYRNAMKVAKRIAITVVCCLPVAILFAFYTRNVIKSEAVLILCFMAMFAIAVLIEEVIARRAIKRKEALDKIEPKRDVFK